MWPNSRARSSLENAPRARTTKLLINRTLSALPLLDSELHTQLRMRPAHHDDRSCPTDITKVDVRSHQQSPLSADHVRCQAHFFCTTFCGARPLALFMRRRSAHAPDHCSVHKKCERTGVAGDYLVRVLVHSMEATVANKLFKKTVLRER
jgi:hypothetical protein